MRITATLTALAVLATPLAYAAASRSAAAEGAGRDVYADTWIATDSIGRTLPDARTVGPPRAGRFVGIFYFVWHGQHGVGGPYDITRILAENPDAPRWGPPNAFHHWGESEWGYYLPDDEQVIRSHAHALVNAGVDFIAFDVTNAFTYDAVVRRLMEVYTDIRRKGGRTPQITFLLNSGAPDVARRLYESIYKPGHFADLWFRWQGRPLLMASPEGLSEEMRAFFTLRQSWAWSAAAWFGDGRDKWPWLDHTPQKPGWHTPGKPEQIPVAVAQHPTTNIGRSHHGGRQPPETEWRTDEGPYFSEQWRRALEVDPEVVFITGWNEWVAQRFLSDGSHMLVGRRLPQGETYFVDVYTREHSRDIEPMRGGYTDNYYYQMKGYIRRFKGAREQAPASAPRTVRIDGRFDDWRGVRPEYRDVAGDPIRRDHPGWGEASPGVPRRYVNRTGRNDFTELRATHDARHAYFLAECAARITPRTGDSWMLLLINADRNARTGWHGYDVLVNRRAAGGGEVSVERWSAGSWRPSGRARMRAAGARLELAVPRTVLGVPRGAAPAFDFQWVDNVGPLTDPVSFAVNGDAAPDRRANYRYQGRASAGRARGAR
ncbi:MAG TPA: hypothetical protein VLH79_13970 [Chthonomonadales bacterium]|nr:hypothetical protein [Chthonomonadales bacterium]